MARAVRREQSVAALLVDEHPQSRSPRCETGVVPVDDGDDLVVIIHNQVVAIQVVMGERVRHDAPAGSIDHSFEPIDSCR